MDLNAMHNKDLWSVLLFLEAAGASGRCVVPEEEAEVTRQKSVKLIGSTSEGIRHPLKAPQHYVSASFSSVRSQQKKSLSDMARPMSPPRFIGDDDDDDGTYVSYRSTST
jgi:hypothetical protein